MHSLDAGEYTTFHFNGDFSGDVIIERRDIGNGEPTSMRIPMSALDVLFARRIAQAKINKLEGSSAAEIIAAAINAV
jgi:hypothetical protein